VVVPCGWEILFVRSQAVRDRMHFRQVKRRDFITLLGGAATAWPLAARAQQRERVRRISMVNDPEASPRVAVFETALRKLGWTERDLRIDYHWGASDIARIRAVAKELVATRPDLIVTVTTPPTQAVRDRTQCRQSPPHGGATERSRGASLL